MEKIQKKKKKIKKSWNREDATEKDIQSMDYGSAIQHPYFKEVKDLVPEMVEDEHFDVPKTSLERYQGSQVDSQMK